MLGMILWKEGMGRRVEARERCFLHVRFLCCELEAGKGEAARRRRLIKGAKLLKKQGVRELILPEGVDGGFLEDLGLRPLPTLPLRRMLSADWLKMELEARGAAPAKSRVAVVGESLSGELVRAVTALSLQYRYVLLSLKEGGEQLAKHLRREYGVALQLAPTQEQPKEAEGALLFAPCDWALPAGKPTLRLYGEEDTLPPLALPPALEEQLPRGVDRGQLFAALLRAGVLRPGQLSLLRREESAPPTGKRP